MELVELSSSDGSETSYAEAEADRASTRLTQLEIILLGQRIVKASKVK